MLRDRSMQAVVSGTINMNVDTTCAPPYMPKQEMECDTIQVLQEATFLCRAPVDVAVPDPDAADHDLVRDQTFYLVVLAIDDPLDLDSPNGPLVFLVALTAILVLALVFVGTRLLDITGVVLSDRRDLEPDSEKVVDVA
jgi:hypothetical protein